MSTKAIATKISQPYAEALFDTVRRNDSIDSITQEVKSILEILQKESELKSFFKNPLISSEAKKNLINKVFETQISTEIKNFMMILVDRGRISMLSSIAERYLELAYEASNTIIAKVFSSTSLNNEQENKLRKKIQAMVQASSVELQVEIDSSLIAGFTVQIGSQLIDTSLRGQLKQMAVHLDVSF